MRDKFPMLVTTDYGRGAVHSTVLIATNALVSVATAALWSTADLAMKLRLLPLGGKGHLSPRANGSLPNYIMLQPCPR